MNANSCNFFNFVSCRARAGRLAPRPARDCGQNVWPNTNWNLWIWSPGWSLIG
jgi:hypothetical protein